jgi:hypothetical protein
VQQVDGSGQRHRAAWYGAAASLRFSAADGAAR